MIISGPSQSAVMVLVKCGVTLEGFDALDVLSPSARNVKKKSDA